jgi:hypothetical protein
MTLDENNYLFCGHGEQMFTVILCSLKKVLLSPNKNSHVCLAPSNRWRLGLTLYIMAPVTQSFQV